MNETVKEHCIHKDCKYRGAFDASGTQYCKYLMVTGKLRGCDISDCDKYERGETKLSSNLGGIWYNTDRKD